MGESQAIMCVERFAVGIVQVFGQEYLRSPNAEDAARLLEMNKARGFPANNPQIEQLHNPNPCPVAAHLALDPRSGRHRRRPRARSKVRTPSPPASRSIQSPAAIAAGLALDPVVKPSSRRSHPPPPSSTPHPPILALCPLSPRSSRGPRTPQSDGRPRVLLTSSRLVLANLHPCYLRGSIVVLPLLPDLLLSGLHCQPPAAAGHADARDPSPGSLCCYRTCCRGSISFELCPSRIQPSPCLEILGKFDINGASWTKRGCLSLDESTMKLGDVKWRSV
nr:uncharacterized protein LOC109776362 [Aegilops tauschii subsp. strangulata]